MGKKEKKAWEHVDGILLIEIPSAVNRRHNVLVEIREEHFHILRQAVEEIDRVLPKKPSKDKTGIGRLAAIRKRK